MAVSKNDQDFWLTLSKVDAWQAVVLSLDINPNTVRQTSEGYPALKALPTEQLREECDKRLKLLTDALVSDPQRFTAAIPHNINSMFSSVRLLEAVTWLSSLGRTSPDWLRTAIAQSPPIHVDDSGISRQVEAHLAQRAAAGLDDDDDEYDPDEFRDQDTAGPTRRRQYLDPSLDRAIELAGWVTTAADVWIQLREMAMREEAPLVGIDAEKGGAIKYTNAKNQPAWLTAEALQVRLKRRARRTQ